MANNGVQLRVDIGLEADADAVELEEAALQLRQELLGLDVEEVERPPGPHPPSGTRAAEAAVLGTLVVTAAQEVIAWVVRTLAGWVARRPSTSVKLQIGDDAIEITDASEDQQRQLIESFLARHAALPE
jgi:hypothetical protein